MDRGGSLTTGSEKPGLGDVKGFVSVRVPGAFAVIPLHYGVGETGRGCKAWVGVRNLKFGRNHTPDA